MTAQRGAYHRIGFASFRDGQQGVVLACVVCGKQRHLTHAETRKPPLPPCQNGCDPTDYILNLEAKRLMDSGGESRIIFKQEFGEYA